MKSFLILQFKIWPDAAETGPALEGEAALKEDICR